MGSVKPLEKRGVGGDFSSAPTPPPEKPDPPMYGQISGVSGEGRGDPSPVSPAVAELQAEVARLRGVIRQLLREFPPQDATLLETIHALTQGDWFTAAALVRYVEAAAYDADLPMPRLLVGLDARDVSTLILAQRDPEYEVQLGGLEQKVRLYQIVRRKLPVAHPI